MAPVSYIMFDIEASLEMQLGALPLPFPGMDSKLLQFSHFYGYVAQAFVSIHARSLSNLCLYCLTQTGHG